VRLTPAQIHAITQTISRLTTGTAEVLNVLPNQGDFANEFTAIVRAQS